MKNAVYVFLITFVFSNLAYGYDLSSCTNKIERAAKEVSETGFVSYPGDYAFHSERALITCAKVVDVQSLDADSMRSVNSILNESLLLCKSKPNTSEENDYVFKANCYLKQANYFKALIN